MSRCLKNIGEVVTMEEIAKWTGQEDIEERTIVQCPDPVEIVGDLPVYETFRRNGGLYPFIYAGHCLNNRAVNIDPDTAIREYVCSPFSAKTKEDKKFYIDLASAICRSLVKEGRMPIAPHLYFPNFLDDNNREERSWGLAAGLALLETCSEMTVMIIDGYISEGMKQEIWHAIYDLKIIPHYIRLRREDAETLININLKKE